MTEPTTRVRLTAGRVAEFTCPSGKSQAFLWDTDTPTLALRVTPTGRKTYVFEARLNGETLRMNLGTAADWLLPKVRTKAQGLKTLVDDGMDPRVVELERLAAAQAKVDAAARQAATFGQAWDEYIEERRHFWSEHHHDDHLKLAQAGGEPRKNRNDVLTVPGPLAAFRSMQLRDVDTAFVHAWATREAPARPARVRLALRLLKAFLRWCAAEPAYKEVANATAASGKKTRETVGRGERSMVVLQKAQLGPWFDSVRRIPNPVIAAYMQCLLLTGRRREQVAHLRWGDVSFLWSTITMSDKTEGEVIVPLTPYMAYLMASLPKRNEWVFSSVREIDPENKNATRRQRYHARKGTEAPKGDVGIGSASGRLVEPSIAHRQACAAAGIKGLTLHGLRGSFASLSEWVEVPAGISAQIQGHAPQGVREQHYIRRPLDLLRMWHEKIETWILEQAGVKFDAPAATVGPRRAGE